MKAIKFARRLEFAPALAELLLPVIAADFGSCDALVPVPLHRRRHILRGFNQADEICRLLARRTSLPIIMSARRKRATAPQTGLSGKLRRQNLRGAFGFPGKAGFRYPLIVDDVITTGTTVNQLAGTLRAAGVEHVGVIAVAYAVRTWQ